MLLKIKQLFLIVFIIITPAHCYAEKPLNNLISEIDNMSAEQLADFTQIMQEKLNLTPVLIKPTIPDSTYIKECKKIIKKVTTFFNNNQERIAAFALPAAVLFYYLASRSPAAMKEYSTSWIKSFKNAGLPKKLFWTYSPAALNFIGLPLPSFLDRNYLIEALSDDQMETYMKLEAATIAVGVGIMSVLCFEAYKTIRRRQEERKAIAQRTPDPLCCVTQSC